jgi:hypothetical protein
MPKETIEFMDDALKDPTLVAGFTSKYDELYDAQGDPKVEDADEQLSNWFDQQGYKISKGQLKKIGPLMTNATGRVIPQY